MTTTHTPGHGSEFDPSEIHFVTQRVSPTEVAAVTAVIRGLLQEESADLRTPTQGASAWEASQRPLRQPLTPGHGQWRGFTG